MKNKTTSLRVLSGVTLVTRSLLIPVADHAGSYGDYITYSLINHCSNAVNQGLHACTYQSLLKQQSIDLSGQYARWDAAFQSRVEEQFYEHTS